MNNIKNSFNDRFIRLAEEYGHDLSKQYKLLSLDSLLYSRYRHLGYNNRVYANYLHEVDLPEEFFKHSTDVLYIAICVDLHLLVAASYNEIIYDDYKQLLNIKSYLTIEMIFNYYSKLIPHINKNMEYFSPTLPLNDTLNKLGINTVKRLKHHRKFKNTQLRPSVLLNYIDHKHICLLDKYRVEECSPSEPDLNIWLSHYKQWGNKATVFDYKGHKIKVHNHTLYNYVDVPYKDGNIDFSVHPKDCLNDKRLSLELNYRYTVQNEKFKIPTYINETNSIKVLRNGADLINEGEYMEHCVGGLSYIKKGIDGYSIYLHVDGNDSSSQHGYTVELGHGLFELDDGVLPKKLSIRQVYGHRNEPVKTDSETYLSIKKYVDNINRHNKTEFDLIDGSGMQSYRR